MIFQIKICVNKIILNWIMKLFHLVPPNLLIIVIFKIVCLVMMMINQIKSI